jgi:hypothetical protein
MGTRWRDDVTRCSSLASMHAIRSFISSTIGRITAS